MSTFAELIKAGKVRAIGASNFSAPRLKLALETSERLGVPRYESLQPLYNLVEREPFESELAPLCLEQGVGVINFYALASGFLTGKYRSAADLKKSVRGAGVGQVPERARPGDPGSARQRRADDRRDAGAGRARLADRPAGHHRADRQRDQSRAARRAGPRGATATRHAVDRADRSRQQAGERMSTSTRPTLSLTQVLICGAAIVTVSMGIRHGFGLWLQPITADRGWNRETFAFALAVQNLAWGLTSPIAGALADRWGAFRVLVVGSVLYSAGLVVMGVATSGAGFLGGAGVLIGMAQAGTTYAIVYGVIGRNVAPERRSWAMGIAAAAGSFGQFLMVPIEGGLIGGIGWQNALLRARCLRAGHRSARVRPARAARARRRRRSSRASAPRSARRSATAASSY